MMCYLQVLALTLATFVLGSDALFAADRVPADIFTRHTAAAERLLAEMTLAEKIGQMTQAETGALGDLSEVRTLALGSVLSGGGSDPKAGNSLTDWSGLYTAVQEQACASRLGIPLFYGIDAVHGHNNLLEAVIFPHNIGLGCTRNPGLVEEVSRITALEMRASGINWNFAPCITVPQDVRWGRTYEGYSEDAQLVTLLGEAAVRGFQGTDPGAPDRVLACAKHYVGDGGTVAEVRLANWPGFGKNVEQLRLDQGDTRCDEATLRSVHLKPYPTAIAAGVGSIMPSYSMWNGVRCSASYRLLTEILKEELGFSGFLISDYNAIDQISDDYKLAIKTSVNAGMDMFMVPTKYREFIALLTELVEEGEVPVERINDAVVRILRVKAASGLLDDGKATALQPDRALQALFGCEAHREVARQAVRESLVLLQNRDGVLPIDKSRDRLCVVGKAADDIGIQCGGWTIEWQGQQGDVTTGGTTILQAIRDAVGDRVTYSANGEAVADAEVALVVVGELPYAEGAGDDQDLELSDADHELIRRVTQTGVPTIVVLLSGRPLILGDVHESCEAIVAAWLPGTEGAGVADVLFGDHPPTGKLSFTWPKRAEKRDATAAGAEGDPLFRFGHGLRY